MHTVRLVFILVFFFNDPATTEIYTLSLHDALPIWPRPRSVATLDLRLSAATAVQLLEGDHVPIRIAHHEPARSGWERDRDRKSTRLNSSHQIISYAVFFL